MIESRRDCIQVPSHQVLSPCIQLIIDNSIMSSSAAIGLAHCQIFKPFTRESLQNIVNRKESKTNKRTSLSYQDNKSKPKPDPYLASGLQLPPAFQRRIPPELIGKPIEDIDQFYANKEVSSTNAHTHTHIY